MITVTLNAVNITELIKMGSLTITDQINQATDTASFIVDKIPGTVFTPAVNQEIIITNGATRIFAGVVVQIETDTLASNHVRFSIKCKDYSQYMDRLLVVDRYEDTNVKDLIDDLVADYAGAAGFTTAGVTGLSVGIKSISFSEIPLSACLDKIARLINYVWYVDYFKDIHFIPKNGESAPFSITDDGGHHIYDTLSINHDFAQIRNTIKVRGGDVRGIARTEPLLGDGFTDTFPLATRFAEKPTVTVNAVPITVGIEYLQDETLFDAMWSFTEKSLRFPGGAPAISDDILLSGIPLRPLVVEVANSISIGQYGVYQHYVENDKIGDRDEAIRYAIAELTAYADGVRGGSFSTYEGGFRSGMTIRINSTMHAVNEDFMVQSVRFKMITPSRYQWDVQVATTKTLSVIDALQMLLIKERLNAGDDETLLKFLSFEDAFSMGDSLGAITSTTTQDYVVEQNVPGSDSYPNPAVVNKSTVSV